MTSTEILPEHVRSALLPAFSSCIDSLLRQYGCKVQEIRIRKERPVSLTIGEKNYFLSENLTLTQNNTKLFCVGTADFERLLNRMCDSSVYSKVNDIASGFITIGSGCRVGLGGTAVLDSKEIRSFSQINLLSIRLARELRGCADAFVKELFAQGEENIPSTLLVSPPKYGKTTILRDTARQLSERGLRVTVIDEKNEIAGMVRGVPSHDIGNLTDVLTDIPKSTGILYAVRNLSPQVILCDEIGSSDEVEAVLYGINAGVPMILSCHSRDFEQVCRRYPVNRLIESSAVGLVVTMNAKKGIGQLYEVKRMW